MDATSPLHEMWQDVADTPNDAYTAVRRRAGVTDLWHLRRLRIAGVGAIERLDRAVTGNVLGLTENALRQSLMLDTNGSVVTDVWLFNAYDEVIAVCDAKFGGDVARMLGAEAEIEDVSTSLAMFRVDGPAAVDLPQTLVGLDGAGLRLMHFIDVEIGGFATRIARVGTTGEFGYVFLCAADAAQGVATAVRAALPASKPIGATIHDLLQLEMRAFNRARDLPRNESALQAGLHWMIDFRKSDFVGREALMDEKQRGLVRRLVAFRTASGGPAPASGEVINLDGAPVGYVANGAWCPTLEAGIGLAYIDASAAWVGLDFTLAASDGETPVRTVSTPFFKTESNRAH